MGSSTAAGAGATTGHGWVATLQAGLSDRGVAVVNLAKGGNSTFNGIAEAAVPVAARPAPDPAANVDAALAQRPKLLLVSYPTNDTALGFGVDETVGNLLAIRAAAQAQGAAVIVLSTQPRALPQAQLALLPLIDARLSGAVAPCFVAVREALAAPSGVLDARYDSGGGAHPNDLGHAIIHDRVRALIDAGDCVSIAAR